MSRPIEFSKEEDGWIFWDETWSDFYGPFKTEDGAKEALSIYCNSYLDDKEPTEEQSKRFKELLNENN